LIASAEISVGTMWEPYGPDVLRIEA
jgi:hypothetical protein